MHGGVLVADLPRLDELAQRLGHLVDGPGRGGGTRPVARHHQHRIEGAASPVPQVGAAREVRVLRANCRLLSSERVSSPPTIPATAVLARSISSVAARTLTSSTRSVIWLVSTKPSTRMTVSDSPSVSTTTRSCRDRRQATPTARLNAFSPRSSGPDRPQRPRLRRLERPMIMR